MFKKILISILVVFIIINDLFQIFIVPFYEKTSFEITSKDDSFDLFLLKLFSPNLIHLTIKPDAINNWDYISEFRKIQILEVILPKENHGDFSNLGKCHNLQRLYITGADICDIPDEIARLPNLHTISISICPLKTLNDNLFFNSSLKQISLREININTILLPDDCTIDLDGLSLTNMSFSDFNFLKGSRINSLIINDLNINKIPAEIMQIQELKFLYIGNDCIEEIPNNSIPNTICKLYMCNLPNLKSIDGVKTLSNLTELIIEDINIHHLMYD